MLEGGDTAWASRPPAADAPAPDAPVAAASDAPAAATNFFIGTGSPTVPAAAPAVSGGVPAGVSGGLPNTAALNSKPATTTVPDHAGSRTLVHAQNQPAASGGAPAGAAPGSVFKANPSSMFQYPRHQGQMELHDTSGGILASFGNAADDGVQQSVGQTVPGAQGALPIGLSQGLATAPAAPVRVETNTGAPAAPGPAAGDAAGSVPAPQPAALAPPKEMRKQPRMPGTKQCPSCQATIAAAVAKCPKCAHVFRPKKDKPKRSGKRGKKNCPKCAHENPSACSSCKKCGYVFRLKLMDRYKQMRPRASVAGNPAVAAAAAHAVAMGAATTPAASVATTSLPMPSGVQQYTIAQGAGMGGHPHAIPPLAQHGVTMHQLPAHHVAQGAQGLPHLPPHQMHPGGQHHQL